VELLGFALLEQLYGVEQFHVLKLYHSPARGQATPVACGMQGMMQIRISSRHSARVYI